MLKSKKARWTVGLLAVAVVAAAYGTWRGRR